MREIENALLANHKRLYHIDMEAVAKSTLSEAINRRNPEIFKALFEELLDRVMAYAPKHKFKFKNPLKKSLFYIFFRGILQLFRNGGRFV